MALLLKSNPVVLTTAVSNPTIPGAIALYLPNTGNLNDEWQAALGKMIFQIDQREQSSIPVVTFAYSLNHWHSPQPGTASDRLRIQNRLLVSRRLGGMGCP